MASESEQAIYELLVKASELVDAGRWEEAAGVYDEAVTRFGKCDESAYVRARVCDALTSKGALLVKHSRGEQAIEIFDRVLERCRGSAEPELQVPVAQALVHKGSALESVGRSEDAIGALDAVVTLSVQRVRMSCVCTWQRRLAGRLGC